MKERRVEKTLHMSDILYYALYDYILHIYVTLHNFYNIFMLHITSYISCSPQKMSVHYHLSYKEVCFALSGDGTGRGAAEPLKDGRQ